MVESGSFPNSESDDPLALNQDSPADAAPEAVDDDHAAFAAAEAETDAGEATGTEAETATPGGFDRFRANALAAGGWCFEKAGFAAAQARTWLAATPATLASGLSALVLGGVLAYPPSKKPVPDEAESKSQAEAKAGGKVDPKETGPDAPEPERIAEAPPAPAEPDGVEPEQVVKVAPDAAASKTPSPDPAPAPERAARAASLLALPTGPEPLPPGDPVNLTAGVDDSGFPELPAVDKNAGGPTIVDADHEPAPAITDAPGLSAAYEIAQADVKPGDPPHEDAAAPAPIPAPTPEAAPVSTPVEAKPTPEPEAAPAPAPAASPTEPPAPAASTPAPPQTEAEPMVQSPAPSLGATPAPAAEPVLPLAAPAAVTGAAVKETFAASGLAAGLGAAAGAAMSNLGGKPAEPSAPISPAEPHDAKSPAPSIVDQPPQIVPTEQAPQPQPQPSETPAPASPASNPPPAQTQPPASSPGLLPSLGPIPEGAPASPVDKPSPTMDAGPLADAKAEPTAEPDHPDWVPIRRSGNLVVSDFDRDPGLEDDPFDRRDDGPTTDPDAHADKEMSFNVETYPPRGQKAGRDGRGLQASPTAPAQAAGKLDTVLHKVEHGENFYSISQSYYSSGRYYRALANANADKFKRPEDLFVGAVIRVPAPEDLDPSYIDPPGTRYGSKAKPGKGGDAPLKTADAASPKAATPIRRARRSEIELNLPVSDPAAERASDEGRRPAARAVAARRDFDRDDEPEAASRSVSTRPVHKVQPDETLRTIARDRLGSGQRADEIFELNRDTIDDPSDLIVGQILELPDDAKVARPRSRR